MPAASVRERFADTVALDRRAKAIAEERGIGIVEAYELALDGDADEPPEDGE